MTASPVMIAASALRRWCGAGIASALVLAVACLCGPLATAAVVTAPPAEPDAGQVHLIYLHGRAVEDGGPRPVTGYGLYEYPAILDALAARGAMVISAQRAAQTDVDAYAGEVVAQIETLIRRGVPAARIVVVGFSKGGTIAVRVSSSLRRPEVRYVLLAACPHAGDAARLRFTGRVLSLYETSDDLCGSCASLAARPEVPVRFEETALSTGLSHGAFYRVDERWLAPTLDWAHAGE